MTPAALARLHAACFTTPRPWTDAEFAGFLADPVTVLVGDANGFALGRVVAGEAELLTLAVDPGARRQGLGRRLLANFLDRVRAAGADRVFLEVAADNVAARSLYGVAGFAETGRRRGYYRTPEDRRVDAVVMARDV